MTIESSLTENKYNPIDPKTIFNKESFNNALNILELDNSKKLKFSEIKKNYDYKKEYAGGNMELKDKFNKAFILIRQQYADYLLNYNQ